jgi:hypothetical protein
VRVRHDRMVICGRPWHCTGEGDDADEVGDTKDDGSYTTHPSHHFSLTLTDVTRPPGSASLPAVQLLQNDRLH